MRSSVCLLSVASRSVVPGADCSLARRFLDRLGRRIAEGEQDLIGAVGIFTVEFAQCRAEGVEAEVSLAFGAVHTVEKGREFNQFETGVHEIEIQNLLPCHKRRSLTHYSRVSFAHNFGLPSNPPGRRAAWQKSCSG